MKTKILKVDTENICFKNIKRAADIIKKGGLVAFPTETVYGLGANAFDSCAVVKIFEVKNRPRFDPIIVHIHSHQEIKKVCSDVNERTKKLMKEFWPGPLTLLLKKSNILPDIVTAGLPTVAVRMPFHPIALALIKECGTPIAAPSANPFGYLSPTTAHHVQKQLGTKVDLILDGGRCPLGVESTIIDVTGSVPVLLRPGGLPVEDIEQILGEVRKTPIKTKKPRSPGQLESHYAPHTPIQFLPKKQLISAGKKIGLLAFTPTQQSQVYDSVEVLTATGDLREAATNLFSCLHRLDAAGLDIIYVEPVPEIGLGRAIMDRLRRASAHRVSHHY